MQLLLLISRLTPVLECAIYLSIVTIMIVDCMQVLLTTSYLVPVLECVSNLVTVVLMVVS